MGSRPMDLRASVIRTCAVLVGVALVIYVFQTRVGVLMDVRGAVGWGLTPLWMVPYAIFWLRVRSLLMSFVGGLVLIAATSAYLLSLYEDEHSTAGIGLLVIPGYLSLLSVALGYVDSERGREFLGRLWRRLRRSN